MQTLTEIRSLLNAWGARPAKKLGQCFLIDLNLMRKLIALADPAPGSRVLEVGAGTGSLTEELLRLVSAGGGNGRVVACEIDADLHRLLVSRFCGVRSLTLLVCDALASKHEIQPGLLEALQPSPASMVSNLPYSIATPLIAECMIMSWRAARGDAPDGQAVLFERMTFTVQKEVAERLTATGGGDYGPVGVLVSLLGRVTAGAVLPPSVFWPAPAVESRMLRIDFDHEAAAALRSVDILMEVARTAFGQRRKQMISMRKRLKTAPGKERFLALLAGADIDPASRPEAVRPEHFRALTNLIAVERSS